MAVDDDRRMAFERLRPLCSKLLEPGVGASTVLDPLRKLLEDLPSSGIRSCAEYISFPLLLLLDAAVASRSQNGQGKSTGFTSDKVAEGAVSCLEVLLARSPVTSSQQMAVLIRKLAAAAMLTPEQASEEFRHGVIKCLKAMFENLQCCTGTLCPCKASKEAASSRRQGSQASLLVQGEDCVVAALQSEDMSAAVGNLFFYLLQISHVEASRADAGSGTIRADALSTVRVLMKKVGTVDALAFFLPGIASGLNKVIRSARVTQRSTAFSLARFYSVGAAGNSRSLEEAVRALAELLSLVLADDLNSPHLVPSSVDVESAVAALEALRQGTTESSAERLRHEGRDDKSDMKVMRVERSKKWLDETAENVNTVLSAVFPALCAHAVVAVRLALVEAAGTIALACQQTLARSMPLLLETLLALACDDSKPVTLAATQYLAMITARGTSFARGVLSDVINRLLEELPKAVLAEDEGIALLHARRFAASMYLAGPSGVFQSLFQSPASSSRFVSIMTQCLTPAATFTGSFSRFKAIQSLSLSDLQQPNEVVSADELPRPPPWFDQAGKTKLYALLALAFRFAGFSSATGFSARTAITDILDSLQATLRDCAAHCSRCDFQTSTRRMLYESGKLRRAASTAVCALSEIIYGASGIWLDKDFQLFGEAEATQDLHYQWTSEQRLALSPQLIDATGTVLHDYLELWDLPVCGEASDSFDSGSTEGVLHLLQDNATLQQVLVEAVGVCGMALGPSFLESGFIGLVIYPLLEKLGCSTYSISHAASISLQAICRHANYGSVRELVVSNSDYVVDALCRQLRHMTVYPHSPIFLAAILQQTGAAADLLPLLEEPTRAMLLELEIAGRRQHPHLTVPILKALREITKAAQQGSSDLMSSGLQLSGDKEKLLETLLERNRCQRAVLTVATSSITSSAPLVASQNPQACILALGIIEHGMAALSKIEAAYKHDKAQKQAVQSQLSSQQDLDENEDINEANKLLPTMHRIWPHLVAALRHSQPSVVIKCLDVVASVTEDCGGDFLARRFQKDAIPLMVKLLQYDGALAPSRAEISQIISINQRQQNLGLVVSQDSMLKVREAVLECIRAVASSKASSTALKMVLETVVAKVIVIACSSSSNSRLKEAAMNTAVALSSVNPDLVWIMVADLAFESHQRQQHKVPAGFPSLDEILPPLSSTKDALCLQYAGVSASPQLDKTTALLLLARLEAQVNPGLSNPVM